MEGRRDWEVLGCRGGALCALGLAASGLVGVGARGWWVAVVLLRSEQSPPWGQGTLHNLATYKAENHKHGCHQTTPRGG